MNNKRKAGFSMVEVVIALAIILAVSIVAISITLSSITNRITIVNRTHAQYFADNVWECFKAETKDNEYVELLKFTYPDTDDTFDENVDFSSASVESSKYNFRAELTVDYTDRPTITVEVKELDDGDEIISFTYTKGAKYDIQ